MDFHRIQSSSGSSSTVGEVVGGLVVGPSHFSVGPMFHVLLQDHTKLNCTETAHHFHRRTWWGVGKGPRPQISDDYFIFLFECCKSQKKFFRIQKLPPKNVTMHPKIHLLAKINLQHPSVVLLPRKLQNLSKCKHFIMHANNHL